MARISKLALYQRTREATRALRVAPEAVWAQHSATGWQVMREAGPHGAARPIGECLTAREADALLQGLAAGGHLAGPTEAQTLAALACSELLAAVAGGGDAAALALPVALAQMATGAAPIRPVINGLRWGASVTVTDHAGRDVVAMPARVSPAGALAACRAAGWPLTAPAAALADRHQGDPDPEAIGLALAARGECPAAIAACR